jgi:hypothetical protein
MSTTDTVRQPIRGADRDSPATSLQTKALQLIGATRFRRARIQHLFSLSRDEGEDVSVQMRKTSVPSFLLATRGFHWVSEYPYNR